MELKVEIKGEEKNIKLKSLKGREAQKFYNKLKEMEETKDENKALEITEKFKQYVDKIIIEYSDLTTEDLEELTVDERSVIGDYYIEQAQKHIVGFTIASQKQEN